MVFFRPSPWNPIGQKRSCRLLLPERQQLCVPLPSLSALKVIFLRRSEVTNPKVSKMGPLLPSSPLQVLYST